MPGEQAGGDGGREDQEAGRGAGEVQGPDPQDPTRPLPGSHQGPGHPASQAQAHVLELPFSTHVIVTIPFLLHSLPLLFLVPSIVYIPHP
jgi:hypothetical protein